MGFRAILSQDRKTAVIHFDTGKSLSVYHSESKVDSLVLELMARKETHQDETTLILETVSNLDWPTQCEAVQLEFQFETEDETTRLITITRKVG